MRAPRSIEQSATNQGRNRTEPHPMLYRIITMPTQDTGKINPGTKCWIEVVKAVNRGTFTRAPYRGCGEGQRGVRGSDH